MWLWKAVRWWWWDVSGAVNKLRHHHPFIWQPTPTNRPVKLRTIQMFLFRIYIRICIRWIAGGCCCYFYWSRNGGEWCSIGETTLMMMMLVVALTVIVVEGRVWLPTGSEFFSVLTDAVVRVGGGTVTLSSSLMPLSLSQRRCRLCCCVIVVIVVVLVECRCYLRCFRFSFSSLLLLSLLFSFFVTVSLSTPFRSVVLRISGVTTVIIWRWRW